MKKIFLLFFATICFNLFSNEYLPEPYNSIDVLPPNYHGWFGEGNQKSLRKIFKKNKIKTVVELGSWLGASTIYMAQNLPENGKLYAIDHWEGSVEHLILVECKDLLPTLYNQFLSNIIHKKLTHKVIPLKMTTQKAVETISFKADLIYVDASHEEKDVYNDLKNWYPKLSKNGVMCGDDWSWEDVKKAVIHFAKENKLDIVCNDNFWRLKKKKLYNRIFGSSDPIIFN